MTTSHTVRVGCTTVKGERYLRLVWKDSLGREKSEGLGREGSLTRKAIERRRLAKERELIESGAWAASGPTPTLAEWLARYQRLRPELSESTVALLAKTGQYLTEFLGADTPIDRITHADAAEWRAWLAGKQGNRQGSTMAGASLSVHLRNARVIFGRRHGAMKLDLIRSNPFDRERVAVRFEKKPPPDVTEADMDRLFDACPSPPWRALVALCALAGLRRGEALALTWSDVQWDRNRLIATATKVTGAKPRQREVLMVKRLQAILLDVHEQADGDRVCDGVRRLNLHRNMRAIMRRSGLPLWSRPFHGLRAWRDTTWKQVNPEYVVDAWLGHGPEVSRAHYLAVPEGRYEVDTPRARLRALIESADDVVLTRMERLASRLATRVDGKSTANR